MVNNGNDVGMHVGGNRVDQPTRALRTRAVNTGCYVRTVVRDPISRFKSKGSSLAHAPHLSRFTVQKKKKKAK